MGTRRRVKERWQRLWNLLALAALLALGIVAAPEPPLPAGAVAGSHAGRTQLVAGGAVLPAAAALSARRR